MGFGGWKPKKLRARFPQVLKCPWAMAGLGEQRSQEPEAKCLLRGGSGWSLEDGE